MQVNCRSGKFAALVVTAVLLSCSESLPTRDCEVDADCGVGQMCGAGVCRVGLQLAFLSPLSGLAIQGGKVEIQLQVSGGEPSEIEITVNDGPLAKLTPPFQYQWDTSQVPEGTYTLKARFAEASHIYESAPIDIQVDRTRPTVISRVPAPGAENVRWRHPITVTFSEAMQLSSLNAANVGYVSGGGTALAKSIRWSDDGKSMTVVPTAFADLPSMLSVSLPKDLADKAGNPIVLPDNKWEWNVPAWQDLGTVDDRCVNQGCEGGLRLVAGAGDALAAVSWVRNGTNSRPWEAISKVSRWTGTSWEEFGQLPSSDALRPSSIDMDIEGRVALAWVEWKLPERRASVRVKVWNGQKWIDYPPVNEGMAEDTLPRLYLDFAGNPGINPDQIPPLVVRVSPQGNPLVVWYSEIPTSPVDVLSRLFTFEWDGSKWNSLGIVNPYPDSPIVAMDVCFDKFGQRRIAYYAFDDKSYVYSAKWSGASWEGELRRLENIGVIAIDPADGKLALGNVNGLSGGPYVVTVDHEHTRDSRMNSEFNATLSLDPSTPTNPQLGFWPDSTVVASWSESDTVVKHWNGKEWVLLGSQGVAGCRLEGSLALSKTDKLVTIGCHTNGEPSPNPPLPNMKVFHVKRLNQ